MSAEDRLLASAKKVATRPVFWHEHIRGLPPGDAPFIAACDPDTIARLCAVVQAARAFHSWSYDQDVSAAYQSDWWEVDVALRALDGDKDG